MSAFSSVVVRVALDLDLACARRNLTRWRDLEVLEGLIGTATRVRVARSSGDHAGRHSWASLRSPRPPQSRLRLWTTSKSGGIARVEPGEKVTFLDLGPDIDRPLDDRPLTRETVSAW